MEDLPRFFLVEGGRIQNFKGLSDEMLELAELGKARDVSHLNQSHEEIRKTEYFVVDCSCHFSRRNMHKRTSPFFTAEARHE